MPTTTDHRLALIDAEILRCRNEMQRALVQGGEGVVLQSSRRKRNISRENGGSDSTTPELLPWKTRLDLVHTLLGRINQGGTAERLFRNVMRHLHETNAEIQKLDVRQQGQWKDFIEVLRDSRDYYTDKADTLSLFTGKFSPFHLFDAIAQGLRFNEDDALNSDASVRDAWLGQLLGNVGLRIKQLNETSGYFDRAISRGSGAAFSIIADVLQGIDGTHGDGGRLHKMETLDWRNALAMVMEHVERIGQPDDDLLRAVYDNVKMRLGNTVRRMADLSAEDLNNPEKWNRLYDVLRERMVSFETLSFLPVVAKLFKALSTGMEVSLGKRTEWMERRGNKDMAIESVLNNLGAELGKLDSDYYEQFLPKGGAEQMAAIARILSKAGK